MRAMFVIYMVLIPVGITFCIGDRAAAQLMRRFLRENSLSIVLPARCSSAALAGQAIAGHADFNERAGRATATRRSRSAATSSPRPSAST